MQNMKKVIFVYTLLLICFNSIAQKDKKQILEFIDQQSSTYDEIAKEMQQKRWH